MADQPLQSSNPRIRPSPKRGPLHLVQNLAHQIRRGTRDSFTRDNVISNLKTLAWVIPLTFLIWVYAEREQISTYKDEPLPFELVSVDPNRVVTLNRNQDKNLMVDLQGPQARVQDVLLKLRGGGGAAPQGIRLEVDPSLSPNKEHELNTVQLLRNQKIFSDYGITVLGCQPAQLLVTIDEVVEREAKIVPPPSVKNLENSSAFDPPAVKVRGPKSKLDEAAASNGNHLTVYADIPEDLLRSPGHHDLADVAIQRPQYLIDDRVSILSSSKIKAALDVRAADVMDVIPSMPIALTIPDAVLEKMQTGSLKVDRTVFRPFLTNVHVVGPREVIDAMKRPEFAPRPRALLDVSTNDVGDVKPKTLTFVDLPKGVDVTDEDKKRTVDFRLVASAAGE